MKVYFKNASLIFQKDVENVNTTLANLARGFVAASGSKITSDNSSVFKMFSSVYGGKILSIDCPLSFTTTAGTYKAYLYITDAVSSDGETSITSSTDIYGKHGSGGGDMSNWNAFELTSETKINLDAIADGHYFLVGIQYIRDNSGVAVLGNVGNMASTSEYTFFFE